MQQLLEQGVKDGVAPSMVLLLWQDRAPLLHLSAGQAEIATVFDLASLTKPLATALLALDLKISGALPWETSLTDVLGQAVPEEKQEISLARLLTHSSGLPDYQPYFDLLNTLPRPSRRGYLKAMLMNQPLQYKPGEQALYSDLGYMLAGILLEEVGGQRLDAACERIYGQLEIEGPRYLPLDEELPWPLERIAPCGPLPGRDLIHGQVEDENAYAMGGVAGHAGLFGEALQVASVMDALCACLNEQGPWPAQEVQSLFELDSSTPQSSRTPGFDTPSGPESAAGASPPPGLVGHLGFTGTSLWWHPESNRGAVLLTNRVAMGRDNQKIKPFRQQVHNLAWRILDF